MTRAAIHIVDDDPDIRDGLAWLFDSRGYQAATWDGGAAFLDGARALQADWGHAVVLLDIRMEPLSGLVTFERLKALACPWPVLFLTGNGDVNTAVAAVKSGAWDFMEKPFQDNELVDRVEQALAAASKVCHLGPGKPPSQAGPDLAEPARARGAGRIDPGALQQEHCGPPRHHTAHGGVSPRQYF